MAGFAVFGVEDLAAALSSLPERVEKTVVLKAIEDATFPLVREMRAEVRRQTKESDKPGRGRLHRPEAIGVVQRKYRHAVLNVIGPLYSIAPHAHLVEFGHRIVTGGSASRVTSTGIAKRARAGTGKGKVGGRTRAFPFGRTAFEKTKDQIVRNLIERIGSGILKEANRRAT